MDTLMAWGTMMMMMDIEVFEFVLNFWEGWVLNIKLGFFLKFNT